LAWHASHPNENATIACGGSTMAYEVTSPGTGGSVTFTAPVGAMILDRRGNSGNPLTITQVDPADHEWEVDVQFPSGFVSGTVTATGNNFCGTGPTITLAVRSIPAAPLLIGGVNSVCRNSTVCYSTPPSAGATSYTWTVTGGAQVSSGQGTTSVCIKFKHANTSSVMLSVKANNACGSSATITKTITVNQNCRLTQEAKNTGITDALTSLSVYPNPTTGKVVVAFNSGRTATYKLTVVDIIGRIITSENISTIEGYNEKAIDLEHAAKGIYILLIEIEGVEAGKLKIVVE
jgi:hypothetical protein